MEGNALASSSSALSKRPRSKAASSDDSDSGSSAEWSDLNDDEQWLSKPDRDASTGERGSSTGNEAWRARSVTPEKITSMTPLKDSNVGMRLLKLMGWRPGSGLGSQGSGRTDPVPLPTKMDGMGLGKANIETRMLEEAISQRPRVLDSMRIANETDEERIKREAAVASKSEIKAMIQDTLAKFYCDICSKGYANVRQWEEHINSYGHNHAKRKHELAMQSRNNKNNVDEVSRRREKEKRREQQELERMVKAAGGKVPVVAASGSAGGPLATKEPADSSTQPAPPKRTGFFKIAGASTAPPPAPTSVPPPPPALDDSATSESKRSGGPVSGDTAMRPAQAPRFAASSTSSLASTFAAGTPSTPAQASQLAQGWRPLNAPQLHPLLASDSTNAVSHAKPQARDVRNNRNDLFKKAARSEPTDAYEVQTAASSQGPAKQAKSMAFVPSMGASSKPGLATMSPAISFGKAAPKKQVLDMGDEEEDDDGMASLPTGRPKAQQGKITFGRK